MDIELFAWVGEDELGSGKIGLKQGMTGNGLIAVVAVERHKVDRDSIVSQIQAQADKYGKPISLVRFVAAEVLSTLGPRG